MTAECIPGGFEWKDPSKIHVGEVFHLLDHWRDREDQGLEPLVWIQTSPPFKNTNPYARPVRCPKALDPHDSDEEMFVLPDSDEPCQGPSHGGSYMDKGAFHIRIGLPPLIVSGDYLTFSFIVCARMFDV